MVKINSIIDRYIKDLTGIKRSSLNTVISYKNDLNQFEKFCDNKEIFDITVITERLIRSYIMYLNNNSNKAASISRKLATLRGLFEYAIKNEFIKDNPLVYIKNPKQNRKLPETVEYNAILAVFEKAREEKDEKEKALVIALFDLIYGCALRVSEACNIKVKDIDFEKNSIRILGKGSKLRIVPIGQKTLISIRNYLNLRENVNSDNKIFVTKNGNEIYSKFVYRIINKYLSKVTDIEKKSPHVLRHAAATHMLNLGADLLAVKEILGHENLSTTQIYTHVSIERLKNTYKTAHPKS
ncbi:MAG: tyrosine-type recombinase/integrase [bacterium]